MPFSQLYIMLIDDDDDDLQVLTSSFKAGGIPTRSFTSGKSAVAYLKQHKDLVALPRFIILDYNMPGADGQDVLLMLKADKRLSQIPVVIYSTSISGRLKEALMALGAHDCLEKATSMMSQDQQIEQFTTLVSSFNKNLQTA